MLMHFKYSTTSSVPLAYTFFHSMFNIDGNPAEPLFHRHPGSDPQCFIDVFNPDYFFPFFRISKDNALEYCPAPVPLVAWDVSSMVFSGFGIYPAQMFF